VNELLIGLVGALVATNQPLAVSNLIQQNAGVSVSIPNPNDPAEKELRQLMVEDDDVLDEVDKWIRDNNAFAALGAGESREASNQRIRARLEEVRKKYQDFLQRYPDFARGHLAYGTFLNDINEEEAAGNEFKKAAELDPKNPGAWNNLANYYGEFSPVTNAFADYARAIELDPTEPVYYHNLAITVYLYRKDAMSFYGINEQQVFDKALALYREAIRLDPDDLPLATDYAECYYGIRPLRTKDALAAWTNALRAAHNEAEREGIYIHLARIKIAAGLFDEARVHLAAVTNSIYAGLRDRLERNLAEHENAATNTNTAGLLITTNAAPANSAIAPANTAAVSTNVPPRAP
jgi:tetratricopeptide (TPR) repeat protein